MVVEGLRQSLRARSFFCPRLAKRFRHFSIDECVVQACALTAPVGRAWCQAQSVVRQEQLLVDCCFAAVRRKELEAVHCIIEGDSGVD